MIFGVVALILDIGSHSQHTKKWLLDHIITNEIDAKMYWGVDPTPIYLENKYFESFESVHTVPIHSTILGTSFYDYVYLFIIISILLKHLIRHFGIIEYIMFCQLI
jgi:hypothetical protein